MVTLASVITPLYSPPRALRYFRSVAVSLERTVPEKFSINAFLLDATPPGSKT